MAWYQNKYRNRRIDLIVAVGLPSQIVFPDIPTIFCAIEPDGLSTRLYLLIRQPSGCRRISRVPFRGSSIAAKGPSARSTRRHI